MMIRTLLRVGQTRLTSHSYLENVEPTGISICKQYRTFTFQRCLLSCSLMIYVIFLNLSIMTSANPVFVDNTNFAQFQSARNIRNLPCIVRKSGRSGVCMFAIDCIKQNGTHLGTCIDRFYFGSCCQLKDETLYASEISDNSIDQNTISHFVHESTTLHTISTQTHINQNHSIVPSANTINKFIYNVTQSYATTSTTPTKETSSNKAETTKRPLVHATTYKNSHFVVRTTMKPSQMKNRTTFATTTFKPVRHTTVTTIKPLLTTLQHIVEHHIEETTIPSKLFTFQMVETTNPSFTESISVEEQFPTTQRPTSKPIINVTSKPLIQTVFNSTEKSKPKPSETKRPVIMTTTTVSSNIKKNTTVTKRPTTYKPIKSKPTKINGTFALDNNIIRTTDKPSSQIYLDNKKGSLYTTEKILQNRSTTQKPQRIVTIPTTKLPIVLSTTLKPTTTTTSTKTSTTSKPRPTVTKLSAKITTTTEKPKTTPTTKPTTTTIPTTVKPATSTTIASTSTKIKTTTTTTTTTTSPTPTTTTTLKTTTSTSSSSAEPTEGLETAIKATLATTTTPENRPGLVTWSNIDAEPTTNTSSELDWQPRPPPSDWIIVSTIAPESSTKLPQEQTTDKMNVLISESTTATSINISSVTLQDTETILQSTTKLPNLDRFTTTAATISNTIDSNIEETTGYIDTSSEMNVMSSATNTPYNETFTSSAPITSSFDDVNYRQICGRRMFPEPRIVGGSNAAFGRWPWQVSLRQWRTSTYLHKCGAALLNENWAITAAHCVDNVPPSDLLLRLGEYDLAEEEEPYGYQERRVQIVASHPQFDSRTFEYDLALLRFYEPVIFQPNIIPVCVPDSDYDFIGQTAFVTGWGRLYEDGPLPSVLQEVAVPVINNTICESMYRAAGYIEHIPHIFICAGWKKGGYDSCEGDSGGPMVLQREEDKRFVLGGVISWGIGCAEANQPGVYTRISEFRDWINQILQF